jgi:hypothetical protein
MGTHISTTQSPGGLPLPFQKDASSGIGVLFLQNTRSKRLLTSFHVLLCWQDKRCSFFFVGLKNWRPTTKKR